MFWAYIQNFDEVKKRFTMVKFLLEKKYYSIQTLYKNDNFAIFIQKIGTGAKIWWSS